MLPGSGLWRELAGAELLFMRGRLHGRLFPYCFFTGSAGLQGKVQGFCRDSSKDGSGRVEM